MKSRRKPALTSGGLPELHAFGDSLTASYVVNGVNENYIYKTANALNRKLVNHAVSGHQAADQFLKVYNVPFKTDSIYTVLIGTNDGYWYGTNATKLSAFSSFHRALVSWLAVPDKIFPQNMSTAGTVVKTSANSLGMKTSTDGGAFAATVNGTAIYVWLGRENLASSEYSAEIRVDGNIVGTIAPNGVTVGSTSSGTSYSTGMYRFAGLSSGNHAVQVINRGTNTMYLEAVAGNTQTLKPFVYVGDIAFRTGSGYVAPDSAANTTTFCNEIDSIVSQLIADGLNVVPFEVNSTINTGTDLLVDNIHWNTSGHDKVYAVLLDAIT